MKKIFISHADEDQSLVDKLKTDLRRYGSIWHFQADLRKGPNLHKQIDEALGDADYVLCIVTKNYVKSDQALDEAYAMFDDDEKLRILYFENIKNLKSIRPRFASKWGIDFTKNYEKALSNLVESTGGESNYVEEYAQTQLNRITNPFCSTRSEFEDPTFIAKVFYEPEKEKYNRLTGPQAVIMEGGRGSGKTMILRSLEAIPAIERTGKKTFRQSGLKYFGVYVRVHRGGFALSNQNEIDVLGEKVSKYLFLDDMNLQFAETLIDNLYDCTKSNKMDINKEREEKICNEIWATLKSDNQKFPTTFASLKDRISYEKNAIRKFIVKQAMGVDSEYDGCYTELETFKKICSIVTSEIPELNHATIYLLIDECENFLPMQQKIVNTLIKLADNTLTLKIASKFEGISTLKTVLDQELQRNHDYVRVQLDYDLSDPLKKQMYKRLVIGVTRNYLKSAGFPETDIRSLLPKGTDSKILNEDMLKELDEMLRAKGKKIETSDKKEIARLLSYYRIPLLYRALSSKRLQKDYSGFDTFLYLSSGIIRFFLDLCGMAFLIAAQKGLNVFKIKSIPPEIQSRAAHSTSHALLEKLAMGEDYGIKMQRFVLDMGDIFRTRLLYDNNEPETIRLAIEEPQERWTNRLQSMLNSGLKESVFQRLEETKAMRTKNPTAHRPTEYILNRIYAPALGITYTVRWRTLFKAKELDELLDEQSTSRIKTRIISQIKREKRNEIDLKENASNKTRNLDAWR